ncbi:hypothetical protein D9M70_420040 [compost metagenome]
MRRHDRLAFDHPVHARWCRTAVQRRQLVADGGVGLGTALVVAHIFDPGRHVIGLGPGRRVLEVAHQRPVSRTVANANAPAFRHGREELGDIVVGDLVIDHDDDGAAARLQVQFERRFVEAVERIEIERSELRQGQPEADHDAGEHQQRGAHQRIGGAILFGRRAPEPAAAGYPAEGHRLVERQCSANDPARCRELHGRVEQRQRQHPAGAGDEQHETAEPRIGAPGRDRGAGGKTCEGDAHDRLARQLLPQSRAEQRPADRAETEGAEHQAVGERPALNEVASDERQECEDRACRKTEEKTAQQNLADVGRHRDIAQARGYGAAERLARQGVRRHLPPPAHQRKEDREIAERIGEEGGGSPRRGDDRAADRRADAAGDVEAHAVERDCRRQVVARDHVADRGLPGWVVERCAAADEEGEEQEQPGRDQSDIGADGQKRRDGEHETLRHQHDPPPIEIIGKCA